MYRLSIDVVDSSIVCDDLSYVLPIAPFWQAENYKTPYYNEKFPVHAECAQWRSFVSKKTRSLSQYRHVAIDTAADDCGS